MERNTVGGKFHCSKIWLVPLGITLAGAIAFAVLFRVPDPNEFKKDAPKPQVGEFGEVFLPLLPRTDPVYTPAPKGTVSLWRVW